MTDTFGRDLEVGDTVVWCAYRCLYVGKVIGFTPKGLPRVIHYDSSLVTFYDNPTVIRTKAFTKIKQL